MRIELLWLLGCKPEEPNAVSEVSSSVSELVPTVVTVTWRTEQPVVGWVEFGPEGEEPRQTPRELEPRTEHEAVLVGLPPETAVSLTVRSEDGADSEPQAVTTGPLSGDLPVLSVTGEPDALWRSFPVLSASTDDVLLVVLDPMGRIVWSWTDTRGGSVFRSQILRDGTGIVYSSTLRQAEPSEASALIKVRWDGTEEVIPVPWLAHDFVELPDGTLVSLAYVTVDGVQGNELVSVAPDGVVTAGWSTFDCFDPVANPGDDPEHGWTHANALDYDEATDSFLVGMRNLGTIAEVDRATGGCGAAYGGTGGNVVLQGATFYHQHQFERTADHLLVFDNDGAPGNESRVLEYALDSGELVSTFRADPPVYSFILGDVSRQPDGDTLVTWSVAGLMDRMGPDGTREMRIEAETQAIFGFTQVVTDPYRSQ
jgi:hypothetical protein